MSTQVQLMTADELLALPRDKVHMWLERGASLVWVVSPKLTNVTVYRSLTDIETLTENDTLDGGEVVPGFGIKVSEIFAE